MELEEAWKYIKGYENEYMVSNLGRVKSLKNNKELIRKPRITQYGYKAVNLYKNGKKTCKEIHRLVAETFIPNPLDYPVVNHKDCDRTNNKLENLEWCTIQYNVTYMEARKRGALNTNYKSVGLKRRKKIVQFSKDGKKIKEWNSSIDVKNSLGYDKSCICRACKGRSLTAYGYIWRYKDEAVS